MGAEQATPLVALSIAGSDSSGGAGIAADLKTFGAHGVFGTVAITAITAQNTAGVNKIDCCSAEMVNAQIDAVLEDFAVAFAKTGMLGSTEILDALIGRAQDGQLPSLVIDPVMVASSGAVLLTGDGVAKYRELLAFSRITTPNLSEAELLCSRPVQTVAEMRDAARVLCDLGVTCAVVKGGHLLGTAAALDVICEDGELYELSAPMIATRNTHGSGCTLSAAITANLVLGRATRAAIEAAKSYVSAAIAASQSWQLGKGPGPLAQLLTSLPWPGQGEPERP